MFTSPTLTIGIALLVAGGLVCFGIIRLLRYFREESKNGGSQEAYNPFNSDNNVGSSHVKHL